MNSYPSREEYAEPPRRSILRAGVPLWLVAPIFVLLLAAGAGGGYYWALRTTGGCPEAPEVCQRFTSFWQAWELAETKYVDPQAVKPTNMIDGAIEGMLNSLGDEGHTRYLSSEAAKSERESLAGNFEGVGAYVSARDGQIILQPIEGSPAEKAGVLPGDAVLRVNGEDVTGLTQAELAAKVRGPKGTTVTITVRHEGEELPVDIKIVRDQVNVPSTSWRMLPNNVALIKLNQFSSPSSEEMKKALVDAQAQGARALILDLRNNPGGLVNELTDIASQFLPTDATVLLEQERGGERKPYKTTGNGVATTIPVVVLVNNNTASSAEILAGTLKENNRATVIGVPTFGTATVLQTFSLNDGAEMLLGTSEWLTPNGEQVRGKGIDPNIVVALPTQVQPLTPAEAAKLDDQALQKSNDVQLARGYEYVQGLVKK